jgi:uncharacterized membrane protein YtjA (UPF0391 family)
MVAGQGPNDTECVRCGKVNFHRAATPGGSSAPHSQEQAMLHYAVVFLVIALIAALFGFGGIAASAVGIAKVLFVVFLILAVASFLFGVIRKG